MSKDVGTWVDVIERRAGNLRVQHHSVLICKGVIYTAQNDVW